MLKQKLKKKRAISKQVISDKMKELHQLVDKWEQRLIDTASETISEKIEKLVKQVLVLVVSFYPKGETVERIEQ